MLQHGSNRRAISFGIVSKEGSSLWHLESYSRQYQNNLADLDTYIYNELYFRIANTYGKDYPQLKSLSKTMVY